MKQKNSNTHKQYETANMKQHITKKTTKKNTENKNIKTNIKIETPPFQAYTLFDADRTSKKHGIHIQKNIDCITIGRANVEFYPPEGEQLEYARHYDVFVGGSPANIAAGIARLGLKSAIITRVANDLHGNFVVDYLSKTCNVDCSMVQYDNNDAKTSLAFAERRQEASTIMYRNNAADLYIDYSIIKTEDILKSRSICISGIALSSKSSRKAVLWVLNIAKEFDIPCIIDIDYHPYGWQSYTEASGVLSTIAEMCDIVIGTEEEFTIANAMISKAEQKNFTDIDLVENLFKEDCKIAIIKRGAEGSTCYIKEQQPIDGFIFNVDAIKPWGAGDAFASAFISYLVLGEDITKALEAAAASASINITGGSCTEAMPTRRELQNFIRKHKNQ